MKKRNSTTQFDASDLECLVHFSNTNRKCQVDTDFIQSSQNQSSLINLKDQEIRRLTETINKQDQLILRLLQDEKVPQLPQGIIITKHVQNLKHKNRSKYRKQLLLLKQLIGIQRQLNANRDREMQFEIERLWLDFKSRNYKISEDQQLIKQKQIQQAKQQLNLLRNYCQSSTILLNQFRQQNKELQTILVTQTKAISLLRQSLQQINQNSFSLQFQNLLQTLSDILDDAHNMSVGHSRKKSISNIKCIDSVDELKQQEGQQKTIKLSNKLQTAKKRIKYLQKKNKQVNNILDGLIPLLKKQNKI